MAVTIVDNRHIIDKADATTNYNTGTQNTTDFAEGTACVSLAINEDSGQIFYDGSTVNMSAQTVYVWSANNATQNPFVGASASPSASGIPHALYMSDGTNTIAIAQAGNDRDVFKHADDQVLFQCFVFDTDYLSTKIAASEVATISGSADAIVFASITEIGASYTTLSKALAGGFNTFLDIQRVGNDGITVVGGSTAASAGTFTEVAVADRDTSSSAAHGILREYTAKTFGAQGTIQFGDVASSNYFDDSGFVLAFEDRDVNDDKWRMNLVASTASFTSVIWSDASISSARPGVELDFSASNVDVFTLDAVTFNGLLNAVTFAADASANTQSITNCTFNRVGRIDPATITFTDNAISNTSNASGALLIDADGTSRLSGLSFTAGSTTHGMKIDTLAASSSFTLTNFTYSGYGASGTTSATVFNDSGQTVSLNIAGGDTPTFRNGAVGSSTIVNAAFTLTLTKIEADSEVRILDSDNKDILDGIEQITASAQVVNINSAGSLYTAADVLTLAGGTGTAATITVDTVGGGGEILTVSITNPGSYTTAPADPNSPTGGTGAGAILQVDIEGAFPYNYNFSPGDTVTLVVFHLLFRDIYLTRFALQSSDQTLPIQQIPDRVYSNP